MRMQALCTIVFAILLLSFAALADDKDQIPTRHNEATIAQLQTEMAAGTVTSEDEAAAKARLAELAKQASLPPPRHEADARHRGLHPAVPCRLRI